MFSRLILLCSGATEAQRRARFPLDEPLEPKAQTAAAALSLPRADALFCSPALAARQTAEAAGLAPLVLREDLREQDPGAWAGLTLDEVSARDPAGLIGWITDPAAAAPGGESLTHVAARAEALLAECLSHQGTLIAVTHPALIRAAVALTLAAPLTSAPRIDVEPLSLTELTSDGRRWHLRRFGA